ncbi:MAG: hypothetical protein KF742_10625 [Cryobacterium sp.]|nr:hypothetical protein [Cryobacterium sp.]
MIPGAGLTRGSATGVTPEGLPSWTSSSVRLVDGGAGISPPRSGPLPVGSADA